MWRVMLPVVDRDDDSEEAAELGHDHACIEAKTTGGLSAARFGSYDAIEPTARRQNPPATMLLRSRRPSPRGGGLRGLAAPRPVRLSRGRPRDRRAFPCRPG